MTDNIFIFDRNLIRKKRNRSAKHLKEHGFLVDWSLKNIKTRLQDIKKDFPKALQIGCRSTFPDKEKFGIEKFYTLDIAEKLSPDIQADEELLPFATKSFDLIISPLNLHSTNDLPGTLAQIKNCLKDDGVFIGAMFGGETLHELRDIMNKVEIEISGGLSPHIAPFADMQQMGSLIQRAGFNLPVIDSEKIKVTYDNVFKLIQDLRLMGEGNALIARKKSFSNRQFFTRVAEEYAKNFSEENGKIEATFEIIFLIGWAPHESQQKPLKPGSAETSLADALKVTEEKLSC